MTGIVAVIYSGVELVLLHAITVRDLAAINRLTPALEYLLLVAALEPYATQH